jgi:hypothetical protein
MLQMSKISAILQKTGLSSPIFKEFSSFFEENSRFVHTLWTDNSNKTGQNKCQ